MEKYYIQSTNYSLIEGKKASGQTTYTCAFRVYTLDGKVKQKRLGGFKTKKEAAKGFTDYITQNCQLVTAGIISKADKEASRVHDYTFSELLPLYIQSVAANAKASSVFDFNSILTRFFVPIIGDVKLSQLSTDMLYRVQDTILGMKNDKGQPYSYNYQRRIFGTLSGFLSYAESRYGYINNYKNVKAPKRRVNKSEMQFWTPEQYHRFLSAVDDPMYHALFAVLIYTGRRKGEVLALQASDIKDDRIMFTKTYSRKTHNGEAFSITSTKNEKRDYSLIPAPLREALQAYPGNEPFFFGGDKPIHENTLTHRFNAYCKAANLDPIRIHDLRHSFVSNLIHLGASVLLTADMIGDTPEQIMRTYGHLYNEDRQAIIDKIT